MTPPASPPSEEAPLDWTHREADVRKRAIEESRSASEAERAMLCAALDLLACHSLTFTYRLRPRGAGRYALTGRLVAEVEQACVVSLEPVPDRIEEAVDVEFWPAAELANALDGPQELDAASPDDPEPIDADGLHVGRVVYETLAAALDPFPRTSGESLGEGGELSAAPGGAEPARAKPFAALGRLRGKPERE
jgi:hypothetical protein